MLKDKETMEDLKYLLGNIGIEILMAIHHGAKDHETIKLFSGIPISCIKGRIPVLLDLNLIMKIDDEYHLKERGLIFKEKLDKERKSK
ncbi:MAG: hypothetical protein EU542_03900 [Promethearchaeota archaeon]|nr:MAG: hypothetical protein EU542_03900 [Candidatus Lokiarchaeota archaeon]